MASLTVGEPGQVGELAGVVSDIRWSADLSQEVDPANGRAGWPGWPAEPGAVVTMEVE
jgi:hypothetical protein